MATEREFESVLARYPDLIENGLKLIGRQTVVFGRRMDLIFRDQTGRQLITELKWGPIKDAHIGQIMAYEGMLLSAKSPDIRVMLIGTRVPPNLRASLDHHGIAWKEITAQELALRLREKGDLESARLFEAEGILPPSAHHRSIPATRTSFPSDLAPTPPDNSTNVSVTLRQKLSGCENVAALAFIRRALGRNQKTTDNGLRFDDANGQVRWYVIPQVSNAKVIQKGRFNGDEVFWGSRLSSPESVAPKRLTNGAADLRFHLLTAEDCASFEEIAMTEAKVMRLHWEPSRRK